MIDGWAMYVLLVYARVSYEPCYLLAFFIYIIGFATQLSGPGVGAEEG